MKQAFAFVPLMLLALGAGFSGPGAMAADDTFTLTLGPLKPGTYKFVGEYRERTAHGEIVAK